jgi:hypothetical protein
LAAAFPALGTVSPDIQVGGLRWER